MRKNIIALAVLLSLAGLPLVAQQDDAEQVRADLLTYVHGLARISPAVMARYGATGDSLTRSEEAILKMTPDELRAMKAQLDRVPFWRDVPAIVAYTATRPNGVPLPSEIARSFTPAVTINPDAVRQPLLAFVRAFRSVPAEKVDPSYQKRIARVEELINNATPEELMSLNGELQKHTPEWNNLLSSASQGKLTASDMAKLRPHTDSCGQDFAGVICEINAIIGDVANFFNSLPQYATNAFNSIKNIFTNLAGQLPTSWSAAANLLGLNNVNWSQVATTAQTYAKLPCPQKDFQLTPFGRVGDIRTYVNFSGTIGFAGNTISDVMPGDILTSLDLQALMKVINFPIQWLSRCLQNSWQDEMKNAEQAHFDLVERNLDVVVSTRASQTSVDAVQAQEVNTSGDVAKVEAKLDRLNTTADAIENTTKTIIATTDRTEAVANRLETTSIRLDTTATRLEGKVDNLQLQQGQTSDTLKDFQAQMLRMLIEKDLLRAANDKISLFQLPQKVGGYLELARSIVEQTLANRQAAGVNTASAAKDLASAVQQYGMNNYKSAYSFLRSAYQKAVN